VKIDSHNKAIYCSRDNRNYSCGRGRGRGR
jgi:hypothetical protein